MVQSAAAKVWPDRSVLHHENFQIGILIMAERNPRQYSEILRQRCPLHFWKALSSNAKRGTAYQSCSQIIAHVVVEYRVYGGRIAALAGS